MAKLHLNPKQQVLRLSQKLSLTLEEQRTTTGLVEAQIPPLRQLFLDQTQSLRLQLRLLPKSSILFSLKPPMFLWLNYQPSIFGNSFLQIVLSPSLLFNLSG